MFCFALRQTNAVDLTGVLCVEKSQYELCIDILRRLNKVGVLENVSVDY
jgi:hypothetical protein